MGALYDRNYYDDKAIESGQPLKFARIGYNTILNEQSVTASTSAAGFEASAMGNAFTYELWKPSVLPATITIDAGTQATVDYMAFGAHSLNGCEVTLYSSPNGIDYTERRQAIIDSRSAAMFLFTPVMARYWRIEILGWAVESTLSLDFINQVYQAGNYQAGATGGAYVGLLYLGRALAMQRGIYQGHTPGTLSPQVEIQPSKSEGGQWLGRSVVRRGYATDYSWKNLKADWVRAELKPFMTAAITTPFFIAWHPEEYADEVLMGWVDKPIIPSNTGPRDYMSVSFSVTAHGAD